MEEANQAESLNKEKEPDVAASEQERKTAGTAEAGVAGKQSETADGSAGAATDSETAEKAAPEEATETDDSAETSGEGDEPTPNGAGRTDDISSEDASDGKADEKKGFFKKKKDKKDEQIEDLTDKHRRLMAEFENFRKRTEKEKSSMFEMGQKSTIEKILPVVDNFERGLATLTEEEKASPFAEGMDKVYRQLLTTLEGMDVHPIEAVGKEFDPNFHNAVMHIEDENYGENVVAQEFQKGYTYRDSVIRHSMVQVAN
ncbi:MAG: nucleotide exchange factor GrpE [Lachnospiraceae bacterium]|nr:nucleotide exchange factor GrpE [Lachnospiraceae bacterium]